MTWFARTYPEGTDSNSRCNVFGQTEQNSMTTAHLNNQWTLAMPWRELTAPYIANCVETVQYQKYDKEPV
jgi:hypothetical protein